MHTPGLSHMSASTGPLAACDPFTAPSMFNSPIASEKETPPFTSASTPATNVAAASASLSDRSSSGQGGLLFDPQAHPPRPLQPLRQAEPSPVRAARGLGKGTHIRADDIVAFEAWAEAEQQGLPGLPEVPSITSSKSEEISSQLTPPPPLAQQAADINGKARLQYTVHRDADTAHSTGSESLKENEPTKPTVPGFETASPVFSSHSDVGLVALEERLKNFHPDKKGSSRHDLVTPDLSPSKASSGASNESKNDEPLSSSFSGGASWLKVKEKLRPVLPPSRKSTGSPPRPSEYAVGPRARLHRPTLPLFTRTASTGVRRRSNDLENSVLESKSSASSCGRLPDDSASSVVAKEGAVAAQLAQQFSPDVLSEALKLHLGHQIKASPESRSAPRSPKTRRSPSYASENKGPPQNPTSPLTPYSRHPIESPLSNKGVTRTELICTQSPTSKLDSSLLVNSPERPGLRPVSPPKGPRQSRLVQTATSCKPPTSSVRQLASQFSGESSAPAVASASTPTVASSCLSSAFASKADLSAITQATPQSNKLSTGGVTENPDRVAVQVVGGSAASAATTSAGSSVSFPAGTTSGKTASSPFAPGSVSARIKAFGKELDTSTTGGQATPPTSSPTSQDRSSMPHHHTPRKSRCFDQSGLTTSASRSPLRTTPGSSASSSPFHSPLRPAFRQSSKLPTSHKVSFALPSHPLPNIKSSPTESARSTSASPHGLGIRLSDSRSEHKLETPSDKRLPEQSKSAGNPIVPRLPASVLDIVRAVENCEWSSEKKTEASAYDKASPERDLCRHRERERQQGDFADPSVPKTARRPGRPVSTPARTFASADPSSFHPAKEPGFHKSPSFPRPPLRPAQIYANQNAQRQPNRGNPANDNSAPSNSLPSSPTWSSSLSQGPPSSSSRPRPTGARTDFSPVSSPKKRPVGMDRTPSPSRQAAREGGSPLSPTARPSVGCTNKARPMDRIWPPSSGGSCASSTRAVPSAHPSSPPRRPVPSHPPGRTSPRSSLFKSQPLAPSTKFNKVVSLRHVWERPF